MNAGDDDEDTDVKIHDRRQLESTAAKKDTLDRRAREQRPSCTGPKEVFEVFCKQRRRLEAEFYIAPMEKLTILRQFCV